MAIKEYFIIEMGVQTTNSLSIATLRPSIELTEEHDEYQAGEFELPADAVFYEIAFAQLTSIEMAVLEFSEGEVTLRLNDDADLLVPALDFWVFRSTTSPLTKLEIRNDGSAEVIVKHFLLGT